MVDKIFIAKKTPNANEFSYILYAIIYPNVSSPLQLLYNMPKEAPSSTLVRT